MILCGGTPKERMVCISCLLAQSNPTPSQARTDSKTLSLLHFTAREGEGGRDDRGW